MTNNLHDLILETIPAIESIAEGVAIRLFPTPVIQYEDLVQAGILGAMDAARRYDPSRGRFITFARARIYGAMMDEVRANDVCHRRYEQTAQVPTFISLEEPLYETPQGIPVSRRDLLETPGPSHEERIGQTDFIAVLLRCLRKRYQDILIRYWFQYQTGRQSAAELGCAESRISQEWPAAMEQLKQKAIELNKQGEDGNGGRDKNYGRE